MCLSPIYIKNPQKPWTSHVDDWSKVDRAKMEFFDFASGLNSYVAVPCRKCFACLKQRAREWRTRVIDEYLCPSKVGNCSSQYPLFVTLTIRPENYDSVCADPKAAFRVFFERYRYVFGSSCRHFVVSERGDIKGRLHFHGIFFLGRAIHAFDSLSSRVRSSYLREGKRHLNVPPLSPVCENPDRRLSKIQRYAFSAYLEDVLHSFGFIDVGYNTSARAISYCVSYMTKHYDDAEMIVLVSPGFGRQWYDNNKSRIRREGYRHARHDSSPYGKSLPKYYSDKAFTLMDKVEYYWNEVRPFYLSRPSPSEVWKKSPLSRRFASESDYLFYLRSFDSFAFIPPKKSSKIVSSNEFSPSPHIPSTETLELQSISSAFYEYESRLRENGSL